MSTKVVKCQTDLLKKKINNYGIADADEDQIDETYSKDFFKSLLTINEWVKRVPHELPFPCTRVGKDIRGRNQYTNAIFDVMSSVSRKILHDTSLDIQQWMDISPVAADIIKATSDWLILIDKNDTDFFNDLSIHNLQLYRISSPSEQEKVKKYINDLSLEIRKKLMSKCSIDSNYRYRKNATKRYKQLMNVVQQAFARNSSILLIRLDWGYKYQVPDFRGKFDSYEDYAKRFLEVANYRKLMLKVLRGMFGDDIAFFAWKIECGSVKGLHIHWFIGLNGAKHQDRINIPKAIADKWDEVIGNQYAYTWNVNAMQKHDEAILKVIDYSDPNLWAVVGGYADYLTKVDYLVRTRTPKGMRSFGCSKLEKVQSKPKRGPKRSKSMPELDMKKARRAFGRNTIKSAKKVGE